jgi:hypothetical protein
VVDLERETVFFTFSEVTVCGALFDDTATNTPPVIQNHTATPKLSMATMFTTKVPNQIAKTPAITSFSFPLARNSAFNPINVT